MTMKKITQHIRINLFIKLVLSLMITAYSQLSLAMPEIDQRLKQDTIMIANADEVALYSGKAQIVKLQSKITRIAIGDPGIADFKRIGDRQIYLLGKKVGHTNLLLWYENGQTDMKNIKVEHDLSVLKSLINRELPYEHEVVVNSSAGTIVLSGNVSDTLKAKAVLDLTQAYLNNILLVKNDNGDQSPIINLLKIRDPQQVLLEVVIASVDKSLLTQFGSKVGTHHTGTTSYSILSSAAGAGAATAAGAASSVTPEALFLNLLVSNGNLDIGISADELQAMVRVLAKPNIVTISGQEGRFLKGGRTFIPVAQGNGSVSLQEEEFGVGVTFLPTVMDGGRIHLKVAPEVSSLSSSTLSSSTGGSDSTLPVFDTKSVSTTVQLKNGDTLMIGGLLDEETINSINGVPGLRDIPFLGALFRSQSSNKVQTELVVLVRTTLVTSTQDELKKPTDRVLTPDTQEFFIEGQIEGKLKDDEKPLGPLTEAESRNNASTNQNKGFNPFGGQS